MSFDGEMLVSVDLKMTKEKVDEILDEERVSDNIREDIREYALNYLDTQKSLYQLIFIMEGALAGHRGV